MLVSEKNKNNQQNALIEEIIKDAIFWKSNNDGFYEVKTNETNLHAGSCYTITKEGLNNLHPRLKDAITVILNIKDYTERAAANSIMTTLQHWNAPLEKTTIRDGKTYYFSDMVNFMQRDEDSYVFSAKSYTIIHQEDDLVVTGLTSQRNLSVSAIWMETNYPDSTKRYLLAHGLGITADEELQQCVFGATPTQELGAKTLPAMLDATTL